MSETPLKDRIVLVTGASRGIGRSTALGLAKAGAHIIACARTKLALESLDDEIVAATGAHATLIPYDLNDPDATDRMAKAVMERFGRIDVFVHSAGILGTLTPVTHNEPKDFDRVLKINLTAAYRLMRALEPLLRQSNSGRALFFTSSDDVVKGRAYWGLYGACKSALETLVRAWADEIDITPIRCALINPGAIRTKMRAAAFPGEDELTLPHPDEIVPMMVTLAKAHSTIDKGTIAFKDWSAKTLLNQLNA